METIQEGNNLEIKEQFFNDGENELSNSLVSSDNVLKNGISTDVLYEPECLIKSDNSNTENVTTTQDEDPFSYLERNRSTEGFKIELRGLPKFYGIGELKKLMNKKLKLNCSKLKPQKEKGEWIYICFHNEEDRTNAIKILDGFEWKKSKLSAKLAAAVPDPLVMKRNQFKNQRSPKTEDSVDSFKNQIVPLWNISYMEQLKMKSDRIRTMLKKLGDQLLQQNKYSPAVNQLLKERFSKYDGLPCELLDIRHASEELLVNGYRNKCEFTIGINEETKLKTVGFRYGSYVHGTINVGPVDDMPHVNKTMKTIVKNFEEYIRETEYDTYNPENHCGLWKQLTVRIGTRTNEVMVIIGVNTYNVTSECLDDIKSKIINFFTKTNKTMPIIKSLYLQTSDFRNNEKFSDKTLVHLYGSETIVEMLCGLKFFISPSSFFQPNTDTAEILYNTVGELISLSPNITVLDICCGTGTIGLCLAKNGSQILGLESEESAVENSKFNCQQNGVTNCSFFHGRAEDILKSVIAKAVNEEIVAIVDPPRAGLHQKGIIQLRRADKIDKLMYLSCNPNAAFKNFVDLGKQPSKSLLGAQFLPIVAVPVDNFPFTNHCELIILFERFRPNNITKESTNEPDMTTVTE